MLTIRLLGSLFPLLKDIILEGKTIREAAKNSKYKLFVLVGVIFSIVLNFYLVPKVFTLSSRILDLQRELKESRAALVAPDTKPPNSTPVPTKDYNSLDYLRRRFDKIEH